MNNERRKTFIREPDARLIAAAPELLDFALLVQSAIEADGCPEGWGIVQERLRAALAKASGG
jgi:hypothetical protein